MLVVLALKLVRLWKGDADDDDDDDVVVVVVVVIVADDEVNPDTVEALPLPLSPVLVPNDVVLDRNMDSRL